jgi:hypothetical protein
MAQQGIQGSGLTGEETSASHTPGPWRVDPTHPLCIESDRGNIGLVNIARASEADARLIAAAPELFTALRAAQKRLEQVDNNSNEAIAVRIAIGIALAKSVRA